MPKLPRISGKEIIRTFEKLGYVQVRQHGSHVIMVKYFDDRKVGCAIPKHDTVAVGTLNGILKQVHVSTEEFISALK